MECTGGNASNFGRTCCITKNVYIKWITLPGIVAGDKCGHLAVPRTVLIERYCNIGKLHRWVFEPTAWPSEFLLQLHPRQLSQLQLNVMCLLRFPTPNSVTCI